MPTVNPHLVSLPRERSAMINLLHISRDALSTVHHVVIKWVNSVSGRSAHSSLPQAVTLSPSLPTLSLPLSLSLSFCFSLSSFLSGRSRFFRASFCWSLGTSRGLSFAPFFFPSFSLERPQRDLSPSDNLHLHKWRPNRGVGAPRLTATQTRGIINGINTRLPILLRNWVVGYQTAKS